MAQTAWTGAQAEAIRKVYSGPVSNGKTFFPGYMPGSEAVVAGGFGGGTIFVAQRHRGRGYGHALERHGLLRPNVLCREKSRRSDLVTRSNQAGKNPPPARPSRLRCAIYTRKSTEEGLDQEFNSLDAQHRPEMRDRAESERYISGGGGQRASVCVHRREDLETLLADNGPTAKAALARLTHDVQGRLKEKDKLLQPAYQGWSTARSALHRNYYRTVSGWQARRLALSRESLDRDVYTDCVTLVADPQH